MLPRAITGLGVVSAVGIGREAFIAALKNPVALRDGAPRPIQSFDASAYPDATIAEALDFDPTRYLGDKGLRTLDRLTKILVVATRLAMRDAGLKKDGQFVASSPEQVGLCCSNSYASLEAITELDRVAVLEDARYINPSKFPNTVSNSASGYASIWEDLRALNITVSGGNCGALDAVACADIHLDTGRADVLLVGGAEAMSEALYLAFRRLGAGAHLGKGALLGEGAALFSVEPAAHAKGRDAKIAAEILGYGTSFDAPGSEGSLIHASKGAVEEAIRMALVDAGLKPEEIDLVASSANGLRWFDDAELAAVASVLGPNVPVAAPKFLLGETLGAGAAMSMAAVLAWFEGAPPFPLVHGAAPTGDALRTVLVTSIGFYGNASAVVMRRP